MALILKTMSEVGWLDSYPKKRTVHRHACLCGSCSAVSSYRVTIPACRDDDIAFQYPDAAWYPEESKLMPNYHPLDANQAGI